MDDDPSAFPCSHRGEVCARVYCKACHSRTGVAREVTVWRCGRHQFATLYPEYVLLNGERPNACNYCEERHVADKPLLTIGMAHHQDFDGVYFTIQSTRLFHPEMAGQIEFVVVDNQPGTPHGKAIKDLFENFIPNARYVEAGEVTGTSAPRDRVFAEAAGLLTICCDCHVMFAPGSLRKTVDFHHAIRTETLDEIWPGYTERATAEFGRPPQPDDLFHGPLLMDDLRSFATHLDDRWGAGMWGQWSDPPDDRASNPDAPPFEIRMMGLGLFASQPETWLGFHPLFRQFGGEEGFIHEKYRTHGRKVWCLPWLRWPHRFFRPHGRRYPADRSAMIRNYAIGLPSVGISLDRMRAHYLEQGVDPVALEQLCDTAAAEAADFEAALRDARVQDQAVRDAREAASAAESPV